VINEIRVRVNRVSGGVMVRVSNWLVLWGRWVDASVSSAQNNPLAFSVRMSYVFQAAMVLQISVRYWFFSLSS